MFFVEDDNDGIINGEQLIDFIHPEFYVVRSHFECHYNTGPYGMRNVPTHTEDGIPIRKLYVSNLPPKTTRTELFGVFAQYGFIKSCWLRMGEKGPNRSPTPTYAFVTYSDPADAHKALQAPIHEKTLRGRNLRTSPADSWHQPAQDADGRVRWKPRAQRLTEHAADTGEGNSQPPEDGEIVPESSTSETDTPETEEPEVLPEEKDSYDILDILNADCLSHILSYVPITDLIRSERVSKRWQAMLQEYLQSIRTFKTSWWSGSSRLTTAVLRRVLQRVGASLLRLHIDHQMSALNDRTAHTVGKFCPNLEELKVVGMHTKNWNPLIYGCKQLKSLSFMSCNKLTDSSLIQIVKNDSSIEKLSVANNTHVTGLFLTGSNPPKLTSIAFYNCYSLQGTVLCAAIEMLKNLTSLSLDVCPVSMWKIIPLILKQLPKLEELSLSEYMSQEHMSPENDELFSESISGLTELRVLNLFKNIYVTNAVLKQVAQTCTKLESLNVASCYLRKFYAGAGDEGVGAVVSSCRRLSRLDVSYLGSLSDAGLRALALPRLRSLTARGNPSLSAAPFAAALLNCPDMQELDLCGCDGVSEEVVCAALRAVTASPRHLTLRLGGTAAQHADELPSHKLLSIDVEQDLSKPHLRPDFVDSFFEDSSEDSFDDLSDHYAYDAYLDVEHPDHYYNSDEDYYMDDWNDIDDMFINA